MSTALWIGLAAFAALVPLSLVVEALRRKPSPPAALSWAPEIPQLFTEIDGVRVRYIRTGSGPTLVLLHTLRTQLDIFQKVIPTLAREFTVYAVDYPGHGWSDIPRVDYTPAYFTKFVAGFLDAMKIERALVAGVSIGATIPLLLAAERHPGVRAVVSINSYDYGTGDGVGRGNLVARILVVAAKIPVLGETFLRLRNRLIEGTVLAGGVTDRHTLPPAFLDEVFVVGERPGHYQAFLNLIRHTPLWPAARERYGKISVPVLLVYGAADWSRIDERQATAQAIPGARMVTVENAGHFMPLDRPDAVIEQIRSMK
jgi:pimeloyl-ACP methyl ester carboxylesterase